MSAESIDMIKAGTAGLGGTLATFWLVDLSLISWWMDLIIKLAPAILSFCYILWKWFRDIEAIKAKQKELVKQNGVEEEVE